VSRSLVIGDWGNSRLRLWRLDRGEIAERREGRGLSHTGDPRASLADLLDGWSEDRVVLCGMAGARGGLHETPYLDCPVGHEAWSQRAAQFELDSRLITIAPGITAANDHGGSDVMRGEETQVFGAMALEPALGDGEHRLVLPGTHSKWVRLDHGRIAGFNTHMTGELFDVLGASTLFLADCDVANDDDAGFAAGLARSAGGSALTASLFEARSAQLREGRSSGWARGFVSGLLIGTETLSQARSGAKRVVMIGEPVLTARYQQALVHWGTDATVLDGEQCAIAGLRSLDGDD